MATTTSGERLTSAHRAAQLAIRARSITGLITLWRVVDPAHLADTIDVFTQAAVMLALDGHDESAGLAARYFGMFRSAEGIPGRAPTGIIAPRPARLDVMADLRGAALKGIIDARKAGMSPAGAKAQGLVRVAGALVKQVLAGGRMTIINGTAADRQALGWQRVTSGSPCTFCRMVASRGVAYKSERSAGFEPHDGCGCVAEPFYRGDRPSEQAAEYKREYDAAQAWARDSGTMSTGTSNNGLNNYRRWLANGRPAPGDGTATASPATTPEGGSSDAG